MFARAAVFAVCCLLVGAVAAPAGFLAAVVLWAGCGPVVCLFVAVVVFVVVVAVAVAWCARVVRARAPRASFGRFVVPAFRSFRSLCFVACFVGCAFFFPVPPAVGSVLQEARESSRSTAPPVLRSRGMFHVEHHNQSYIKKG